MTWVRRDPFRHRVAGDAAEHGRIGDAVAAQSVGAMHAARVLAGDEQARPLGRSVRIAHEPAHAVMRGRHDLDETAGEIEAAIRAALDHALELLGDLLGSKMRHAQVHAAVPRGAPGFHLGVDRAADHVAGGALELLVVIGHEAALGAVEQIPAGAAQAFLQDRAGHARLGAREQAGRMELHHLHVAQRQAGAQRHGDAVHALVARGRVVAVHGRPAAGGEQHGLG